MSHLCLINPPGIKTTSGLQMHMPNPQIGSYIVKASQTLCMEALTFEQLNRWMIRLYLNFYLLSSLFRPIRTIRTLAKAFLTGREDKRYAKWFRDIFFSRRRWRRMACKSQSVNNDTCAVMSQALTSTFLTES